MRLFRLIPLFLSTAVIVVTPIPARTTSLQDAPSLDATDQAELDEIRKQEELAERREDREQRGFQRHGQKETGRYADPCALYWGEYEGLQVRGISDTSLVAVIREATRENGVLTVRLRFCNEGSERASLTIDPQGAYESFFVKVGDEKLFILKNEDGELEAKEPIQVHVDPGKMESWWASFPAPAASVKAFDLEMPPIITFQDVPISDD